MKYLTNAFAKYFVFQGRANRAQFWFFMLWAWVITGLVTALTGGKGADGSVSFLAWLTGAVFFFPSWAITVRRLHDTNRSGWWILINFVPLIGQIWLFILLILGGTLGPNRFGQKPF